MRSQSDDQASHRAPGRVIPVLFIAGAGRSGSTLLDRVISTQEGFCSIGESRFIWERSFGQNQLCGCGLPFYECAFWEEVSHKAFGVDAAQVDQVTAIQLKESVDRIRYVPWLSLPRRPAHYESALLAYGELVKRLYDAVLRVSDARVIIDSSKDPTHGLVLSRLPGIEVHVLHLVRDSRAVAFSWRRRRKRPEIHWKEQDMPIERVSTTAARWMMQNTLAESLSSSAASYYRLRYEDFLANPNTALSNILAPYEWLRTGPTGVELEVVLEPTHTVSGNPMRFEHGPLKLKLDDEWRRAILPRDRWTVTSITWPLLARYGYSLRDPA